jgi:HlyD family type I secretion membrane fusion protein
LWAYFLPLSSSVIANGKTIIETKNFKVQTLDGGLVSEVYVKNGDIVLKGDILIKLSNEKNLNSLIFSISELKNQKANLMRINKEIDDIKDFSLEYYQDILMDFFSFLDKELYSFDDLNYYFDIQYNLLISNINSFDKDIDSLNDKIFQYKSDIASINKKIANNNKIINVYDNDIKEYSYLVEKKYIDKLKLKEIESKKMENENENSLLSIEIQKTKQLISETENQIEYKKSLRNKKLLDEYVAVSSKIKELEKEIYNYNDTINKLLIKSPEEGKIMSFNINYNGYVLNPGDTILEIVPINLKNNILAKVDSMDIEQIKKGDKVEIKFSSFNGVMNPTFYGEIVNIDPDSKIDESTKKMFYDVLIEISKESEKEIVKNNLTIMSGMNVDLMILQKERTLFDYLTDPISKMFDKAFNEE